MGFITKNLKFRTTKGKRYKSENRQLRAIYNMNKERIDSALSQIDSEIIQKKGYFETFKQLVKERTYDTLREPDGGTKRIKKRTILQSLNSLATSNYFSDQEIRGSLAWSEAFKENAKDTYIQFIYKLQKGGHEKFDPTRWIYMPEESSGNRQMYAYIPKKGGKNPIVVSMSNSPENWTIQQEPKKGYEWKLKNDRITMEKMKNA